MELPKTLGARRFKYTRRKHHLDISKVTLVQDGTIANNECYIKAEVRSEGDNNFYSQVE